MTAPLQRRRCAHLALAATLFVMGVIAGTLYFFPPDRYGFYPHCPMYEYTGLLCPGCGMTRALAAMLRGNFAEAMHWNPLLLVLAPVTLIYAALAYWRALSRVKQEWPKLSPGLLSAAFAVLALFTLGRNLN